MLTHYQNTGSLDAYMSEVRSIRASKIYRQHDFDDTIEEEGKDLFSMAIDRVNMVWLAQALGFQSKSRMCVAGECRVCVCVCVCLHGSVC